MPKPIEKLAVIDGETLQDIRFQPGKVTIDTFQIVRSGGQDILYVSDYEEVRELKKLTDKLQLSILLVHHLCKQGASDPLNKLSGTTGISGAMDAIFILDRGQRSEGAATMVCTGRDIETRKLGLRFSKSDYSWELVQDSLEKSAQEMPEELTALTEFVRSIQLLVVAIHSLPVRSVSWSEKRLHPSPSSR